MDYSCRDIPMRLDINHQPLSFDIYLSQIVDIPRTSLEDQPYNFQLEIEALERIDRMIEQAQPDNKNSVTQPPLEPTPSTASESISQHDSNPPSCPIEVPLTPIKSSIESTNTSISNDESADTTTTTTTNQINLRDFEDIHSNNPFDHIELQTIDELRELDLVFKASYANQTVSRSEERIE